MQNVCMCSACSALCSRQIKTIEFRVDVVEHLPYNPQRAKCGWKKNRTNSKVTKKTPFHLMVYCCFHVWIFALTFFNTEFCIWNADIYKYAYVLNYIGQMKFFFVANAWQNNVLALLFCVISKQRVAHTYTHQPAWITHINQNKTISFHLLTLGFFACPYLLFLFRAGGRVSIHMIHSIWSAFLVRILFFNVNKFSEFKKKKQRWNRNEFTANEYKIYDAPSLLALLGINIEHQFTGILIANHRCYQRF